MLSLSLKFRGGSPGGFEEYLLVRTEAGRCPAWFSVFPTGLLRLRSTSQDYVLGYFQPKLSKLKRYVIAGVDFAGLTPRKSANRESGSWQVRVCSGPELLITGSKHPGLHPGPFSAVPPGLVLLCKPNPALRAGLLSAVPPGLESRQGRTWSCLVQIQAGGSARGAPLANCKYLIWTGLTFSRPCGLIAAA